MALPTPEPGLVLNYAYLRREHRAGEVEGRKARPCLVVFCATRESDGELIVTVLPITHAAPRDAISAVEIPPAVKKHLGLDDARSWIVVTEGNEFPWPGYDLSKAPGADGYDFGFLPPRLFHKTLSAFLGFHGEGTKSVTPRD